MTIALDLETLGIESRPDYPPKPVGLAFAIQGGLGGYLAFGHPCENNAAPQDAAKNHGREGIGRRGDVQVRTDEAASLGRAEIGDELFARGLASLGEEAAAEVEMPA